MRYCAFIFILTIILSCNNNDVEEADSLLKGEPYSSLTDSIGVQPKNADLYYKRGVLLLQNEQNNYAEKDFKKAKGVSI